MKSILIYKEIIQIFYQKNKKANKNMKNKEIQFYYKYKGFRKMCKRLTINYKVRIQKENSKI